jgi:hypothetical protein
MGQSKRQMDGKLSCLGNVPKSFLFLLLLFFNYIQFNLHYQTSFYNFILDFLDHSNIGSEK